MKRWQWLALGLVGLMVASCLSGCSTLIWSNDHEQITTGLKNKHSEELAAEKVKFDTDLKKERDELTDELVSKGAELRYDAEQAERERDDAFKKRLTSVGACVNQTEEIARVRVESQEAKNSVEIFRRDYGNALRICSEKRRELSVENNKLKGVK
jgi:hypothetical protein